MAYQLASVLNALVTFYEWLVIIWCILSWFPIKSGSVIEDIAAAINTVVSPYISIFQRFIPPFSGIDFSPVVALLVLQVAEWLLIRFIYLIL